MSLPTLPGVAGVEHRYENVNGIRMHYAEAGEGEPVVLQHGWPQHWWMWRDYIGPLAERFRVICPDLRGHGWSDKDRKSTRLNSSHANISYAVFCLTKKQSGWWHLTLTDHNRHGCRSV